LYPFQPKDHPAHPWRSNQRQKILDAVTGESMLQAGCPLLPARAQLSHAEKDTLIAALTARLALADERIAAQGAHIAAHFRPDSGQGL
jgi:hypothetical protein